MPKSMSIPNLILTGFMGTGKSTIGRIVADRLGKHFVDMDHLITQRLGRSVPEIFRDYGEEEFRRWEAAFCQELSQPQGWVIATGGGALIPQANREGMLQTGNIIVCLTADKETLLERLLKNEERPLAQSEDAILGLLKQRQRAYQSFPLRLDTSTLTPNQAADGLIRLYQRELDRSFTRSLVQTPEGSYPLFCGRGLLADLPQTLADYHLQHRSVLVTNTTLAPLYGKALAQALPNTSLITVPDGEAHKNLATVQQLYADFAAAGLDRNGVVIALGGGVLGDSAGFAAATYMRGLRLVQIPTSLLAMVDSSVGGKVGVDIPEGKNLVGAFKQPEMVIIDPDVLQSLPEVERRCGLAEVIKHALLADPPLLNALEQVAAGDPALLRRAIQVKVEVVQRDPYEDGERAHLNLGHTFAHAVEQASGYSWRHGEAVGLGLVAAGMLSQRLGKLAAEDAALIRRVVADAGLPVTLPPAFDPAALWQAMRLDKKWRDGRSHFVILEGIGQPALVADVPREMVLDILRELQE